MVDLANLSQAEALNRQSQNITQALKIIDAGGRINGMLVGDDPHAPPPAPDAPEREMFGNVLVETPDWSYPPQMVDSIKQQLAAKQAEIHQKLTELGVTGVTR